MPTWRETLYLSCRSRDKCERDIYPAGSSARYGIFKPFNTLSATLQFSHSSIKQTILRPSGSSSTRPCGESWARDTTPHYKEPTLRRTCDMTDFEFCKAVSFLLKTFDNGTSWNSLDYSNSDIWENCKCLLNGSVHSFQICPRSRPLQLLGALKYHFRKITSTTLITKSQSSYPSSPMERFLLGKVQMASASSRVCRSRVTVSHLYQLSNHSYRSARKCR